MATKAQLDVDASVTGADDLKKLADGLDDVDEAAEKAKEGIKSLNDVGGKLQNLGGAITTVGATLTAAITVPILGIGAAALTMGANAVETENLVNESFGNMAQAATDWSNSVSEAVGLNKFEIREGAASFNLLALNMGQTKEAAFGTATGLTELAGDLDSFYNLTEKGIDPIQALQSGLIGNSEALRTMNIFVNDADLRQIAFEKGITETNRQLTTQEKFLATRAAGYKQTAAAQGTVPASRPASYTAESQPARFSLLSS